MKENFPQEDSQIKSQCEVDALDQLNKKTENKSFGEVAFWNKMHKVSDELEEEYIPGEKIEIVDSFLEKEVGDNQDAILVFFEYVEKHRRHLGDKSADSLASGMIDGFSENVSPETAAVFLEKIDYLWTLSGAKDVHHKFNKDYYYQFMNTYLHDPVKTSSVLEEATENIKRKMDQNDLFSSAKIIMSLDTIYHRGASNHLHNQSLRLIKEFLKGAKEQFNEKSFLFATFVDVIEKNQFGMDIKGSEAFLPQYDIYFNVAKGLVGKWQEERLEVFPGDLGSDEAQDELQNNPYAFYNYVYESDDKSRENEEKEVILNEYTRYHKADRSGDMVDESSGLFLNEKRDLKNFDKKTLETFSIMKQQDFAREIDYFFQVNVSKLNLKEQINFLVFLSAKSKDDCYHVKNMIGTFGLESLRTFLSLEQDASTGDDIIFLSENLDEDVAKQVFEKYSEIIDVADKAEAYLKEQLSTEDLDPESLAQVRENIMIKGKDILKSSADNVREGQGQSDKSSQEEILRDLQKVKEDGLLLASSVRGLKGLDLETLKNISFETVSAPELSREDAEAAKQIYAENYADQPQFQKSLLEGFDDLLKKDSVQIYTFRDQGEIRGFYALDQIAEGEIEFKSFNLDPSYQGARLGEELMLRGLDQAAKENIIHAQCNGDDFISSAYIERGFVATGVFETTEDGPKHALEIIRDDRRNQDFETKNLTQDGVKVKALEQGLNMQNDTQKFFIKSNMTEHDYELLRGDEDWVLTRSVSDRETGEVYLGYERNIG